MGCARSPDGDGLPADRHLCLRLRRPSRSRERRARTIRRSRTALGGSCSTSCSSTRRPRRGRGPRRVHRRRRRHRGRARRRHPRSRQGRPDRHRARAGASSGRTAGFRSLPRPCIRSSTTRSRRLLCGYYSYWSGLPIDGRFEVYIRDRVGGGRSHPRTTTSRSSSPAGRSPSSTPTRSDVEGNYLKMFDLAPEFAERIRGAKREARFRGTAVRELLPQALRPGLGAGRRRRLQQGLHHGPGDHRRVPGRRAVRDRVGRVTHRSSLLRRTRWASTNRRDEHVLPMFEFTCQLATLEPPPPEMQQLLGPCTATRRRWTGSRASTPGVTSPAEFFSEENVGRIFAARAEPGAIQPTSQRDDRMRRLVH